MKRTLLHVKKSRNLSVLLNIFSFNILNKKQKDHVRNRGHKMAVFANEHIGLHIFSYGIFEKHELELLFEFLNPLRKVFENGVAFDIGSNIGNHSIYFSDKFYKIHSFEPHPITYKILSFNAGFLDNVEAHNFALGNQKGELKLCEDIFNMGASYIKEDQGDDGDGIDVCVMKIDELPIDCKDLCFIKIDVEGFEKSVLEGGLKTIENFQPIVILEQRKEEFTNGKPEAVKMLQRLGYKVCWYEKGGTNTSFFLSFFAKIWELLRGRSLKIVTGEELPNRTHDMLIAVPGRFQYALGLTHS